MKSVRFHPLADEELLSAIEWYLLEAKQRRPDSPGQPVTPFSASARRRSDIR
jgi:hypothetical protein